MTALTLRLLGSPLIELDGCAVQLGRRKAVALLAYLALTRQPHSRDARAAAAHALAAQPHAGRAVAGRRPRDRRVGARGRGMDRRGTPA
jgi:hypothetical protein